MPATSRRTRKSLRVRIAARLTSRTALTGLVVALVVGILGMHALASHGAPADRAAASSAMTSMTSGGMSTSAHEAVMSSSDAHDPHAVTDDGSSGHGMANMLMLCVVILAAAALTLLALLATAGFLRPLLPDAFQPAAVRERAVQWVRGSGPPLVWQFSVIRC